MASPVWPPHIEDRPLRQGLAYQPMANQEVFTPEDGEGLEITWPKLAEAPLRMTAAFVMTPESFNRWLAWWRTETKSGTVPFWLRDPFDRNAYRWKLQAGQQIGVDRTWPNEVRVSLALQRVP